MESSTFRQTEMDQHSRGDLNFPPIGTQTDQGSQGGLIESINSDFSTARETFEELQIAAIEHFTEIPDYAEATRSSHPIIVRSPISCNCIDGWELIEKSRSQGKQTVACHIYHIAEHSQTELAIRKVAIRTLPQGGRCSYAELVRNARRLFEILVASSENPVIFSHGGLRKGVNYSDNKEDNIRGVLAERLGKSVTTVNQYLNHGNHLTGETMNTLIESKADKRFFETFQISKRVLEKNLTEDRESEERVNMVISEKIVAGLEHYNETGKIESINSDEGQTENIVEEVVKDRCKLNLPQTFVHYNGESGIQGSDLPNIGTTRGKIKELGISLVQIGDDAGADIDQRIERVQECFHGLGRVLQELKYIKSREITPYNKEVV